MAMEMQAPSSGAAQYGWRYAVLRTALATSMVLVLLGASGASEEHDIVRAFLTNAFTLTAADFARIDAGHVVSRTMAASDRREVATFGVVRVKITPEFYVERMGDIPNFKKDDAILQIGTFSNPPQLKDVASLTLDDADIRNLRACRVRDCGVQLSATAINRFREEVDWRRADAPHQANGVMRQVLVEYVSEYLKNGSASMEYADRRELLNLRREFVSLAGSLASGWSRFPALRRHLIEYPSANTPRTTDLVYWSKEKIGRKGVASVTHVSITCTSGESPAEYAIASKQIYGTHYFDASLGLTVLLRDRSAPSPAIYLAYLNQSRIDVFGGPFGGLARGIVSSRARATVSDQLTRLQTTLERQFSSLSPE